MRDNPRKNLKWMQQQLMEVEAPSSFVSDNDDLIRRVDDLLEEPTEEAPLGNFSRKSKAARAEQAHIRQQFDESAAVLTKTKKQLRREAKQQKAAEKKANVNRSIGGLVFLAVVECIGILAILGWWLQ